jgi:hypothetical protein
MECFIPGCDDNHLGIPGVVNAVGGKKKSVDIWRSNHSRTVLVSRQGESSSLSNGFSFAARPNETQSHIIPLESSALSKRESASFTMKLYALLEDAQAMGFEDIVSWCCGGKAFKVHNRKEFFNFISPQYFQQTKYKSFLRQLNLYGFERVSRGPHLGLCSHKSFIQGKPMLCSKIQRSHQLRRASSGSILISKAASATEKKDHSVSSGNECSSGGGEQDDEDSFSTTSEGGSDFNLLSLPAEEQEPPDETSSSTIERGIELFEGKTLFPVGTSVLEKKEEIIASSSPPGSSGGTPSPTTNHKKAEDEHFLADIQAEAAPPKRADKNSRNDCFPWKMYDLLEDMDAEGLGYIVSWENDGRAMKIHDPQSFVGVIIPYYFPQTKKLSSFQRQLNLYGFKRTSTSGPQKGFYMHKNFVRGNRELCRLIARPP